MLIVRSCTGLYGVVRDKVKWTGLSYKKVENIIFFGSNSLGLPLQGVCVAHTVVALSHGLDIVSGDTMHLAPCRYASIQADI